MTARTPLPALGPITAIDRRLSVVEHYHACVGTHAATLETRREARIVLEGEGDLPRAVWQQALDRVVAVNPGLRLRLRRDCWPIRWSSDAPAPQVRWVDDCEWDVRSQRGSGFISDGAISLEDGPCFELIVARRRGGGLLVILRSFHAVFDGGGYLHFLQELFRALRGEAPLGTNAAFSDVDLVRSLDVRHTTSRHVPTCGLTGTPQGRARGDEWRRISLGRPRPRLMARAAVVMANHAHQFSSAPALIAVPVDLRRHCPGLRSTMNFSNMLLVPLQPGDDEQVFQARLSSMLAQRMELALPRALDALVWLPLPWLDRLVSRTAGNFHRRRPLETVVVSNLGAVDTAALGAPGFRLRALIPEPLPGNAFAALSSVDGQVEMVLNLPHVLGDGGRFDRLEAYLRTHLADETATTFE